MKYLSPEYQRGRVVLCSLYPPIWRSERPEYDCRLVSAALRAECMVHDVCIYPGSVVLERPEVTALIRANSALIKSGALVLDLRDEARDFNQLADLKFGNAAPDHVKETADFLDELCDSVIHFDPRKSSKSYKQELGIILLDLWQSTDRVDTKVELDRLIKQVDEAEPYLTLSAALEMRTSNETVNQRITAAALYLYSFCGSYYMGGDVQIPESLWSSFLLEPKAVVLRADQETSASDLSAAHHFVLDHYSLKDELFGRLTADDVVEIRSDGATTKVSHRLRTLSRELRDEFRASQSVDGGTLEEFSDYARELQARVSKLCIEQATRRDRLDTYAPFLLEGVGTVLDRAIQVPAFGAMLEGAYRIGHGLSRPTGISHLDLTTTPIDTYVTRIFSKASMRPL